MEASVDTAAALVARAFLSSGACYIVYDQVAVFNVT
jgi:hypothetical protein